MKKKSKYITVAQVSGAILFALQAGALHEDARNKSQENTTI
jgi:hypothetical protein